MVQCCYCGHESFKDHFFSEKMFGIGTRTKYLECLNCGSLQINRIPEDLSFFYPEIYYIGRQGFSTFAINFLRYIRDLNSFFNQTFFFSCISYFLGINYNLYSFSRSKEKCYNINHNSKILDVGCGPGYFIKFLNFIGYKNTFGVDPFIKISNKNSSWLLEGDLFQVEEKFDVIIFNHSLEHMIQPTKVLKQTFNLLNIDGYAIIRIPVVNWGWENYGYDWVQLDAPRHFNIPTVEALENACKVIGFDIIDKSFDSTELLFSGSETYKKGKKLSEIRDFTRLEIYRFREMALKLNKENKGDQACIVLKKKSN